MKAKLKALIVDITYARNRQLTKRKLRLVETVAALFYNFLRGDCYGVQ
jgi:phenylpyruvate tautomerase PptA (4-oxalocrotonate tautomerase family)